MSQNTKNALAATLYLLKTGGIWNHMSLDSTYCIVCHPEKTLFKINFLIIILHPANSWKYTVEWAQIGESDQIK